MNAIGNDGETSLDVAETAYERDTTEVKAAKNETHTTHNNHSCFVVKIIEEMNN